MEGPIVYTTNNIPPGGKAGQVLRKASDDSYEVYWGDESEEITCLKSIIDEVVDGSSDGEGENNG